MIKNIIDKHEGRIWAIKFNVDGNRMITCGEDLTIRIWDMDPAHLTLEVTEGAMMKNPGLSLQILKDLNALGVSVSIDDFGTGYSSLAYLKDLPASELKIDKSFVINMLKHGKDQNIVKATIDLGHALGMQVIAEGVEKEEQRQYLLENGCSFFQGYLYSMPLPIDSFEKLLSNN